MERKKAINVLSATELELQGSETASIDVQAAL